MEIDLKKVWDPKAMIFAVWDLTPSLEQFASKSFGKGLIKPLVQNSRSNFHNRTLSSHKSWDESNRIMKSQQKKKKKKKLTLRSGAYKLNLSHLNPEDVWSHKFRTLAAIFTNSTSFAQESWDEYSKIIKS